MRKRGREGRKGWRGRERGREGVREREGGRERNKSFDSAIDDISIVA